MPSGYARELDSLLGPKVLTTSLSGAWRRFFAGFPGSGYAVPLSSETIKVVERLSCVGPPVRPAFSPTDVRPQGLHPNLEQSDPNGPLDRAQTRPPTLSNSPVPGRRPRALRRPLRSSLER